MIDHDIRSYLMIARVFDGQTEGLTRDDILDNVTLYWLTNTAVSSARLYWDTTQISNGAGFFDVRGRQDPGRRERLRRGDLCGPTQLDRAGVPELIHYNKLAKGTHFAACGAAASLFHKSFAPRSNPCADRCETNGAREYRARRLPLARRNIDRNRKGLHR